jgi:hypothetical protein
VADNLDITVVAIGEEGTLKKFNRMGSNILLTSENPAYEQILLTEGQVSVLGVAVGLVKMDHTLETGRLNLCSIRRFSCCCLLRHIGRSR